jgi:Na+/H+-dicarboxylate symporter
MILKPNSSISNYLTCFIIWPKQIRKLFIKKGSAILTEKKKWGFKYSDNTNILGVISFCVAFGMIISSMGRKAEILLHLFLVLNEITMKLVKIIMW